MSWKTNYYCDICDYRQVRPLAGVEFYVVASKNKMTIHHAATTSGMLDAIHICSQACLAKKVALHEFAK